MRTGNPTLTVVNTHSTPISLVNLTLKLGYDISIITNNDKAPIMRMTGVLTKILEAYLKVPKEGSEVLTKESRRRLRSLREVLGRYDLRGN